MFPVYLFAIFGLILVLVLFCAAYYQIYKHQINQALEDGARRRKPMPAPFHVAIVATMVFLIFAAGISFFIGFGMGYRSLDADQAGQIEINTLCAKVKAIEKDAATGEDTITVESTAFNYEPYHEEFTFRLYEGLIMEGNNQPLSLADFGEGDLVSIVLLTDVSGIEDIYKIQRLDDKA